MAYADTSVLHTHRCPLMQLLALMWLDDCQHNACVVPDMPRWLIEAAAWNPQDIPHLLPECPALTAFKVCTCLL